MRKGYTLIEVLVSLTVIGLLFGFGFASFRDFSRRQAVIAAGRTVVGDLRLAQQKALSGEKPSGCTGNLQTYDFERVNESGYKITAVCSGSLITVKNQILPSGTFISSFSPSKISFKVLGQGTNLPAGEDTDITLTQTSTTNTVVITVRSGGEINAGFISSPVPTPSSGPTVTPTASPGPTSSPTPSSGPTATPTVTTCAAYCATQTYSDGHCRSSCQNGEHYVSGGDIYCSGHSNTCCCRH
jgi:prepilin-type N-terminal cleavage/methylation domain-containing protein